MGIYPEILRDKQPNKILGSFLPMCPDRAAAHLDVDDDDSLRPCRRRLRSDGGEILAFFCLMEFHAVREGLAGNVCGHARLERFVALTDSFFTPSVSFQAASGPAAAACAQMEVSFLPSFV